MIVAISTNAAAEKGLYRDAVGIKDEFEALGHTVLPFLEIPFAGDVYTPPRPISPTPRPFDLLIALEVLVPAYLDLAPKVWFLPNPEWWHPGTDALLEQVDLVLCKTRDAEARLWDEQIDRKIRYLGFLSEDRLDLTVERERAFLHVCGDSGLKGTVAVLDAWEQFELGPTMPLTVVGESKSCLWSPCRIPGVTYVRRYAPEAHRAAQNRHLFHLCPSEYEGFGHTLPEALGVGALALTQDRPPADEFDGVAVRVGPPRGYRLMGRAHLAKPDPAAIADGVRRLWSMDENEVATWRMTARRAFEVEREGFRGRLKKLIGEV